MSNELVGPGKGVERDRWGRPLITHPSNPSAPLIPYTRTTTFVDALSDKEGLMRWKQRMTAIGLASRPDLLLAVSQVGDDKAKLGRLCEEAAEHAGSMQAATVGTELHALTERLDRGEDIGAIPDPWDKDLAAYARATAGLTVEAIETFGIHDGHQIAGTFDRIVSTGNARYIADIKTGSIEYGVGKIAMQLAAYAHMRAYDVETGKRGAPVDVDTERAIIIHLPAGAGTCTLHWVDIRAGWEHVHLAAKVRQWRKRRDLTAPVEDLAAPTRAHVIDLVQAATDVPALEAVWAAHTDLWDGELTRLAALRKKALTAGAGPKSKNKKEKAA